MKKISCAILLFLLSCLAGCASRDHKAEADKTVYEIIDNKWQDDFGGKANYKISDTAALPDDIAIDTALPVSGTLTLSQAVAIATAQNRQYQREKEALYVKALDLRLARHVFEPQLSGGAVGRYRNENGREDLSGGPFWGFDQLLNSGARISTQLTVAWIEILTGNQRSGLRTLLSATIAQPFLRGSDSEIVMETLTQAERDTVYQIRAFNRFRKTFVVSVISEYYRLCQMYDFMQNAAENKQVLYEVYEQSEKLSKAGRLGRIDLDQARQDKLEAKDTYSQAQKEYKQALDEFKTLLSLPLTATIQLDINELRELSLNTDAPSLTDKEDAESELLGLLQMEIDDDKYNIFAGTADIELDAQMLNTVLPLRLDLANKKDAIADAQRKVTVAGDSLRAGLNFLARNDVTSGGGNGQFNILSNYDNSLQIGMELDLPLDRMAEANEYRKSLIGLTQSNRDYGETVDMIMLEVRQAHRRAIEASGRYNIQSESLDLAKKRFKKRFLLLQYSRASMRDVLDAKSDLFDAQNDLTEAHVDYVIATLEFYRDTGVLQVRPDGMQQIGTLPDVSIN